MEVKARQYDAKQRLKNEEQERQQKLVADLEEERRAKEIRKKEDREAAMKVRADNEQDKKKRVADEEKTRKREMELVEESMKLALEKDKAREEEIAKRGRRIQAVMDAMGDVIRDDGKELQIKQDKAYVAHCVEQNEKVQLDEINKK